MERQQIEKFVKIITNGYDELSKLEISELMAGFICINEVFHPDTLTELLDNAAWYQQCDYLTFNRGKNDNLYAWYFDGFNECCVSVDTLEIIPESQIEEQFL